MCDAKFVEIGPVVLEKVFSFHQCILAISLLSPLGKGCGPSFEQIWIPITQACFVLSLFKIGQVVQEKKILKFSPSFFLLLSRLGKRIWPLYLNKTEFPSPNDALCQVWLKLGHWFWRTRFLNANNVFWLFRYHLPLEKGVAPSFEQAWAAWYLSIAYGLNVMLHWYFNILPLYGSKFSANITQGWSLWPLWTSYKLYREWKFPSTLKSQIFNNYYILIQINFQ